MKENYTGQHNPRFASVHFDANVSGRASFHLGYNLGISEFICLPEMQTVQISQCNIFEQQQGKFLCIILADGRLFFEKH